jgi:thiaminase (transcriptional activator TenA)
VAAGTPSRERFTFYMVRDAHYLGAFAGALTTAAAAAAVKATTADAPIKFAKDAQDAIVVERALREGFFREVRRGRGRRRRDPALRRPGPPTAIS